MKRIAPDFDAVAEIAYRVRFSPSEGGTQTAILRRIAGAQAAGTGDGGQVIVEGAPVSSGPSALTEAGDYRFVAGWRSDPFLCDVQGAKKSRQFTGDDFFADKEVSHCSSSSRSRRTRDLTRDRNAVLASASLIARANVTAPSMVERICSALARR